MPDVPRFERKTAFRVINSAAQNIPATTITILDYDTVVYDSGSNFNLATNEYIAPLDGIYSLNGNFVGFHQAAGDGRALITIFVNGVEAARGTDNQLRGTLITDRYSWAVSTDLYLNMRDVVTLRLQNVSGPALTGLATTFTSYFSGHRIQSESRTILGG